MKTSFPSWPTSPSPIWANSRGSPRPADATMPNSPPPEREDVEPWRKLADRWALCGHPEGLLLSGTALASAQAWARSHGDDVTEIERDYLDESANAQSSSRRARLRQHIMSILATMLLVGALITVRMLFHTMEEREGQAQARQDAELRLEEAIRAERCAAALAAAQLEARKATDERWRVALQQSRLSESRLLSASSQDAPAEDQELAILLAVQALQWAEEVGPRTSAARDALHALYLALGHEGWDVPPSLLDPPSEAETRLAWPSGDGRLLVGADSDAAAIWDAASGRELVSLAAGSPIRYASWSPDGKYVAIVGTDGDGAVWDGAGGAVLATLPRGDAPLRTASWSPDGTRLAFVDGDGEAAICDPLTGAGTLRLDGYVGKDMLTSWAPDSAQVLAVSNANSALVWDAQTGQVSLALSARPDEELIAARGLGGDKVAVWSTGGAGDSSYQLWDARTGETLGDPLPIAPPRSGAIPILLGGDGLVYYAAADHLLDFACTRVSRNLTRAEWEHYVSPSIPYARTCPDLPAGE